MAEKLNYDFYDIDDEVKRYYGYKNINEFIEKNRSVVERDKKRSYMIELSAQNEGDKVIAVPPIYYKSYYSVRLRKAAIEVVKIELQDTPENIFERLVFTDENDCIYYADDYKKEHKAKYLKALKNDISGYKAAFSKIENKIDISGKDVECAADYIISTMGFNKRV